MKRYLSIILLLSGLLTANSIRPEYQACLDRSSTTVGMRACAKAELKHQDTLLNRYYKLAMKTLGSIQKKDLKNAQRAWIKYRDANCNLYYGLTGGTMDLIEGDDCLVRMTAERANELHDIAQPYGL